MQTPKWERDATNTVYYRALYYNLSSECCYDLYDPNLPGVNVSINAHLNLKRQSVVYGYDTGPDGYPIALMGNSGDSTGWHLHLEIRRGVILENGDVVEHSMNPHNSMLPMTS